MKKVSDKIKKYAAATAAFLLQLGLSLKLVERVYSKPWPGDTAKDGYTMIALSIGDYGSYYRILQEYFIKNELVKEYSWFAQVDKRAKNRLREIGGTRSILFDTATEPLNFTGSPR